MKLAVWHNLPTGGGLRMLEEQLRGLAARGHDLHVWAPPSAVNPDLGNGVVSRHEVGLASPGLGSGPGRLRRVWQRRRLDIDAFIDHSARCAREMEEIDPDVVLAHPSQHFLVPALGEHLRTPSVLYLQEPNRPLHEATASSPWEASAPQPRLTPGTLRSFALELLYVEEARVQVRQETAWVHAFDCVLVNSLFSRESVLRAYGRQSEVCRPGIASGRFPFQQRPAWTRGTILSVGALVPLKNALFLIEAAALAGPALHRFLWVANSVAPSYRDEVEQRAQALGVPFELRVGTDHARLLASFAEADVFVYAPRLEPLGLAALEAGATGLPVVAIAEGGVRETIVDGVNGVLAGPDPREFGAAVTALLGDPGRARQLGMSAHHHVANQWAMDDATDRLEQILCQTAAREGRDRG